ncbi:lipoamide acyltransferase component of branched-chain alpha-keto acid dehydrogenase complex [Perkinsela sp. CCAP 1560/4]|nr:lipoamide acyltransferase component of branched-chain alpha-keto acid dehydrogenase complex [Perkinsela sp. CCAP 1560/4]|eukprot:KNH09603.1 lipoamide acyltransferase component of branched-chain alpha-keto acid dehydrogenase complex [Perkinsela sp. CCAP 1560/4]
MSVVQGIEQVFQRKSRYFTSSLVYFACRKLSKKVVSFPLADIGEGIHEVEILEWKVSVGDIIEEFSPLCEVRSDKATAEITSKYAGKIKALRCDMGGWLHVGKPLVDIEVSAEEQAQCLKSKEPVRAVGFKEALDTNDRCGTDSHTHAFLASPRIRHSLATYDISLTANKTFESREVTRGDLKNLIDKRFENKTADDERKGFSSAVIKLSSTQQAMARKMQHALQVPSFTASEEIEIDPLKEYCNVLSVERGISERSRELPLFKELMKQVPESPPYRLTVLPLLVKIISESILRFPMINSQYLSNSQTKIVENHNIGIAMDTPQGLIVPNIKEVQSKSILEVYSHLYRLIALAKAKRLTFDDLHGGSFTISNIGSIGSTQSQPVVVPPEVCILSMGRIRKQARFRENGEVYAASVAVISCSADHRVLDGAYVVRFLNHIRSMAENPKSIDPFV